MGVAGSRAGAPAYRRIPLDRVAFSKSHVVRDFNQRNCLGLTVQVTRGKPANEGRVDPIVPDRLIGVELQNAVKADASGAVEMALTTAE